MKPSEAISKSYTGELPRFRFMTANCPLCGKEVEVYRPAYGSPFAKPKIAELRYERHAGSHPQSTKCYWSGRKVEKDVIGETEIRIKLVA